MAEPKKRAIDEAKKRVVKKPDPVTLAYEDERRAKSSHRVVSVDSGLRDSWQDLRSRFKAREGQYTIVREIGRGGMGRVYKVMDNHIMRVVAMKILSPDLSRYRSAVEKFIEEAQATGQLEHPNIVPIYDIGITENRELFYVMKYVKGKTLAEVLFRIAGGESEISSQYSFIRMLQIFQQVCMGVHFAHQRGVLHRDLKPSNIMLGDYGEVMIFAQAGDVGGRHPSFHGRFQAQGEQSLRHADLYGSGADVRGSERH
jgi:serine/threonine protein kinase